MSKHIPLSLKKSEAMAQNILQQMTNDEKFKILGGTRGFFIQEIKRLGIPEVFMSDASCGVNIRNSWQDDTIDNPLKTSVAFPCLLSLAATWNPKLAYAYAQNLGEECRAGGVAFLLGPGMNIYRNSQCGRNFEYLGEDPYLAARLVESYVTGLQSTGVAATLKHFVANNTDYFRRKSNSLVSDRALHEIYFPAFKAGINAGAKAVMTSYNLLNNEWCGQNKKLITEYLRKELGFQWLVMTDWWSISDCQKAVTSGQDLEMPANEVLASIPSLLDEGKIDITDIDRMVLSILKTCIAMDFYNPDFLDQSFLSNYDAHEKTALQTIEEGIVLLKNSDAILPLKKDKKILLTGLFCKTIAQGGGAAEVKGFNHLSLLDALTAEYGDKLVYVETPSQEDIRLADTVILSTGTLDGEGSDRAFALPEAEEKKIVDYTNLNANTVVCVNSGSGIRMTDWAPQAKAILFCWYGGQAGNKAIANIISGKVNPSGKLPITIEKDFKDSPAFGYIPEGEKLYDGWNDEQEKIRPVYDVEYREGIFVGYRWYENKKIQPLFPFGFGLSYTEYSVSVVAPQKTDYDFGESVSISAEVTNTGNTSGSEVIQVYVKDCDSSEVRPEKELKAFKKVFLAPGQTKQVILTLPPESFAFWSENQETWITESGEFDIKTGTSSQNICSSFKINIG